MPKKTTIALVTCAWAISGATSAAETLTTFSAPFSDVTVSTGLNYYRESFGAGWGDFNGDIYPDLVVSNHREKPGLYQNSSAGTFTNLATVSGTIAKWDSSPLADTHGGTWADLNNDGRQDLMMVTGKTKTNTQQLLMSELDGAGNRVLRNRDVEWGINPVANPTLAHWGGRTPVWFDYDFDGSMDMVLASFGGESPLLHQEYDAALGRARLVDRDDAMGFACGQIHYAFLLDVYTPPPAVAGANDYKPELFCSSEGKFPLGVYGTSRLVTRTRTVGGVTQTYQGFNLLGFSAQIFNAAGTARTTVSKIANVADSIVADFNNDGLQDLLLVRGASRPSGSYFSLDAAGNSNLEILFQLGEKGVQFYVDNDTFAIDIDWNKDSNTNGYRDPPLYIGGKNGVVKNIGYPKTSDTLLTKRSTVTPDFPYHHHLDVSPALNLAQFEGAPYRNTALMPYFQLWYEYDAAGKRKWYFRHYGSSTHYGAGYARIQSTAGMVAGATRADGTPLFDTGLNAAEGPMAPTLLLQQRRTNADGSTQGVFVQPVITDSLNQKVQCISATAGDFDNDGDVDFYLACRGAASNKVNYVYQNAFFNTLGLPAGQAVFYRAVAGSGSGPGAAGAEGPVGAAIGDRAGTSDSVVTADYDVDGFLDLFVTNGYNMRPKIAGGRYRLLHNDGMSSQTAQNGQSNRWIELDLVGAGTAAAKTTRDAIGARVYVTDGSTRLMMRERNGGYHRWSQDFQRLHFGLGQRAEVDLEVIWPNGVVDRFNDVAANHLYRVSQSAASIEQVK